MGFARSVRVALPVIALLALATSRLAAQSIISGFVRDSLAGSPLVGAIVQLIPAATPWAAGRTTKSDAIGRYRVDSIPPGQYILGFEHPRLDTLGLDAITRTIEVVSSVRVMRADLAIPGGRTFVTSLCGPSVDSAGAVIGRVFAATEGELIAEGSVVVRWAQMRFDAGGVGRTMMQTVAKFGEDGRYVACGVPTGAPVLVSARAGTGAAVRGSSSEIELSFAPGVPLLHRNLLVALRPAESVASSGTATSGTTPATPARSSTRTGSARLNGRVTASDGAPVTGARVRAIDTDLEATTDTAGRFRITGLPAGTRALEVVAIGYTPVRTSADLRPDREATATISVGTRIATLAAVNVKSTTPDRGGFLTRRAAGRGYFMDGNMLEARGAQNVSQALVMAPSLRGNGFDTTNPTRPIVSGRSNCKPTTYFDGMLMRDGLGGVDDLVTVRRVGGIEVYANAGEAPPQFNANGNCAVILVWSRAYVP